MQVDIQARGFPLTEALKNHVRIRIGYTLSRVVSKIRRVDITLSDLNGPRGGGGKRCLIQVRIDGLSTVVIEDIQSDMYTAIDRAVGRAARTVMRRLALLNSKRRHETAQRVYHPSTGM